MVSCNLKSTAFAVAAFTLLIACPARGYETAQPWGVTALDRQRPTDGFGTPLQGPVRLTWHVVADGVPVFESFSGTEHSNEGISFLESTFGVHPTGTNPMIQPWYAPFRESFDRIESLSGVDFSYEIFDDGARVGGGTGSSGGLTVRADMRIAALPLATIANLSGVLAYNYPPDVGDMVINTQAANANADTALRIGNPANNYRAARNLFTHEIMHGLGVEHTPSDTNALMYPSLLVDFDGPQFDDIAALHQLYNDARDQRNAGLTNPEHIIDVVKGGVTVIGGDASNDTTLVTPDQSDFVSVTNQDKDYFRFELDESINLIFVFNPVGPGSASDVSLLSYKLYNESGDVINEDAASALGRSIGFLGTLGPGIYNIELAGESASVKDVQMYNFAFSAVPEPSSIAVLSLVGMLLGRRRRG